MNKYNGFPFTLDVIANESVAIRPVRPQDATNACYGKIHHAPQKGEPVIVTDDKGNITFQTDPVMTCASFNFMYLVKTVTGLEYCIMRKKWISSEIIRSVRMEETN